MAIAPPFFEAGNAPFEHVFSGTYLQKIDKFHRISLPKEIRLMLLAEPTRSAAWILWQSNHVKAIEATTERIFSSVIQKSLQSASGDELTRIRQTASVYGNVYKVLDSDGRVTVPAPLRLGIQFENSIVIVGMGAFFHIWPSAEYERFYRPAGSEKMQVGDHVDVFLTTGEKVGPGTIDVVSDPAGTIQVTVERPRGGPYTFKAARTFFTAMEPGRWELVMPSPSRGEFDLPEVKESF